MKPRMTTEQFIARARERYGDAFSFERCEYRNMKTPVLVTCPEHGEVEVNPDSFLNRARIGCPRCSKATPKKPRKYTTESLVAAYREIWGDEFDYSGVEYVGWRDKVRITHRECGRTFWQAPASHLKYGCQKCSAIRRGAETRASTGEAFIARAQEIHGHQYCYGAVSFKSMKDKVLVRCRKHDIAFSVAPLNHLHPVSPTGCPACGRERQAGFHAMGAKEFAERARRVHGDQYDYGEVEYVNNRERVAIRCRHHGIFMQSPYAHLSKSGCPVCSGSRMERRIYRALESLGVSFAPQHTFSDCRRINPLPFDFAILSPDGRALGAIEYHGDQHFRPVDHFGGTSAFRYRQENDRIKAEYCQRAGIPLLVATTSDDANIEPLVAEFCKSVGAK